MVYESHFWEPKWVLPLYMIHDANDRTFSKEHSDTESPRSCQQFTHVFAHLSNARAKATRAPKASANPWPIKPLARRVDLPDVQCPHQPSYTGKVAISGT
ncbi:hypothetical protein PPTG_22157 [Phytophthora nicotianae INRA-310]|uniref:Uncharacterized protein n=1 Tax=Phytophthora nicotianae (strain INRA-310) TaxID=761204 RepID=W2QQN9_PHYN3|nr:hypothetical protein PPTG_22157 [Phytophthora nicotianae INRA-310]ETN14575.1 hypothetical protein PPTG_22157 [Phytophthora nicotianae INRA-310]